MISFAIRLVLLLCVALPVAIWWKAVGSPGHYLQAQLPPGQLFYVLSKLAGLLSITLLGLQVALVPLSKMTRNATFSRTPNVHRWFGIVVLIVVSIHVFLFVGAASQRSGHFAYGLLGVRLSNGFYDQIVSVGAVAFYLLICAVLLGVFLFRKRRSKAFRYAHRICVTGVVVLAVVHSFSIGSETATWPMMALYFAIVASLVWAWRSFSLKR